MNTPLKRTVSVVVWSCLLTLAAPAFAGATFTVTTHAGGVTLANPTLFNNVNALGIGTTNPVTLLVVANNSGAYYYTPVDLNVTLSGGDRNSTVTITARVSTDFANTNTQDAAICAAPCGSVAFTTITVAGGQAAMTPTVVGTSATFTPDVGTFIFNTDGAAAFRGTDNVTITFTMTTSTGQNKTATLSIRQTVQDAVALQLATGTAGPGTPCTISAGSGTDFGLSFGNVNGLGVGTPTCGSVIARTSTAATYATSYQVTASYSSQAVSAGTLALTTSGFVNSSTLTLLEGSAATTAALTTIPVSGTGHSVALSSPITTLSRFLGLMVASTSGSGSFPGTAGASGSDSATLTFTMTVP